MIPANSSWDLWDAYDINDDGVIAADGWYQPHDANGNPTGSPQWRACLLVPIKFEARAARANEQEPNEASVPFNPINHGFDPPIIGNPKDPLGESAWASVTANGTNDVVDLVMPQSLAPAVELVITSGTGALRVSPDISVAPLTQSRTNLSLIGLDIGGVAVPATVEVRLRATGATLASMKVTVFPIRTVSLGIYRIADSQSMVPTTAPLTPTDSEIIATMNDIFKQAGVQFRADNPTDESAIRDIHFDVNNDGKVQHEEYAAIEMATDQLCGTLKLYVTGAAGDDARGETADPGPDGFRHHCFVFKGSIPSDLVAALNAAHEAGHALNLSTNGIDLNGFHDELPPPPESFQSNGSLMHPGHATDQPGRWLPHEDWDAAWETADHQR